MLLPSLQPSQGSFTLTQYRDVLEQLRQQVQAVYDSRETELKGLEDALMSLCRDIGEEPQVRQTERGREYMRDNSCSFGAEGLRHVS